MKTSRAIQNRDLREKIQSRRESQKSHRRLRRFLFKKRFAFDVDPPRRPLSPRPLGNDESYAVALHRDGTAARSRRHDSSICRAIRAPVVSVGAAP